MTPQTVEEDNPNLYLLRSLINIHKPDEWRTGLDDFTHQVRLGLIFDHLVVYKKNGGGTLEPIYARAVGRGRTAEADAAWGDMIGNQAIVENRVITTLPPLSSEVDRLDLPFGLSLPLSYDNIPFGALVLIRFGGPIYSPTDIEQAQGYSSILSLVFGIQKLSKHIDLLTSQNRQISLQDSFISTITHELKSPLGFIKGFATTLLRPDTSWDTERQQEFLKIIDSETDHLQVLVDNILDSAQLQSNMMEMNMQPVQVESLIHNVILRSKMHYPAMSIHLDVKQPGRLIKADPRRMEQVFENLINNSAKYAPASPVWITIFMEGTEIVVQIRDEGPGIPHDSLEKVFWRFYRDPGLSKQTRGSGLGLYICKQIVDAHQGKISVESNKGEGTKFTIQIPSMDEV
jgi:K+-sensing histidine kinase KdpD